MAQLVGENLYAQCCVCGERAMLPMDAPTHNRDGKRTTVGELIASGEPAVFGTWYCNRHTERQSRSRRYA